LADPSLRDPYFTRSVLILTEHQCKKGAHGFILNRPLGKKVSDVLSSEEFSSLHDIPVYLGGPVATEQLSFASFSKSKNQSPTQALEIKAHISAEEAINALAEGVQVRAFIGHSDWESEQLEEELRNEDWIPHQAKQELIKMPARQADTSTREMWSELLCSKGPQHRLMAGMPENPSLN